jgi:hypothetical protein
MMHIFTTCPDLIRTLPDLPHATSGDPEDAGTDSEDHAPDALRYMLVNLGSGPEFVILPERQPETQRPLTVAPGGTYAIRRDANQAPSFASVYGED